MKSRVILLLLTVIAISGCVNYKPSFRQDAGFYQRLVTQEKEGVKVSVAGLSAQESKEAFGVNLAKKGILPLWFRIENNDSISYFFAQRSVAENYYADGEAAYISRIPAGVRWLQGKIPPRLTFFGWFFAPFDYFFVNPANKKIAAEFKAHAFPEGWIKPGETKEGFVFVPNELGSKEVHADLYGSDVRNGGETKKSYEFIVDIPGIKHDYRSKNFESLYPPEKITNIQDPAELKNVLEALPCCVTNKKGEGGGNGPRSGDPINLIVIGTLEEVLTSFTMAKWDETEIITFGTVWKMIGAFSAKKKYLYSPVSPLYLYGRSHDLALQKARDTIHERMHLRLWLSPIRFKGKPIWVGAVSRDIGIRWTTRSWNLMTHKIDPDFDASMTYVLMDLFYSWRIKTYDFVEGVPPSTPENPTRNLSDDFYFTKGKRLVVSASVPRNHDFPGRLGLGTYFEDKDVLKS